ncbi:MAG: outer membrane beta-barrel protein, partial [Candidatus Binatia bacterium]
AEVIEAPSNPNFTRSFMFGFSIPFTHTGLLFSAPIGEMVSLTGGVVNGWDNVVDNNDDKTFLGSLALTPLENIAVYLNGTYGNESTDGEGDARGIFDLVATANLDPISLSANFDYGSEGEGKWVGFAGIVGLDLQSAAQLPLGIFVRGEVFDDQDGFRTGTEQQLHEITLTCKWYLTEKLTFWVEYRHDGSDEDVFGDEGIAGFDDMMTPDPADDVAIFNVTDTQDTALFALSYVF